MAAEKQLDGDMEFSGVNELLPPAALKPGEVAVARNARFRLGSPEPRYGCVKLPWTNKVTLGASSTPLPFASLHGVGSWRDASDVRWIIIAAEGKIFATREGNGAKEIQMPSGVTITGTVSFTQTVNGLICFRGASAPKLLMKTLDLGFEEAPSTAAALEDNTVTGALSENPTDGTTPTPDADRGEWIANRLFTPYSTSTERDLLDISDYLNATRSLGIRSQARINQGSNDPLVRVIKFGKSNTAIAGKGGSVYAISNITGALESMTLDEVSGNLGFCSPTAVVNVGKEEVDQSDELWFLANKAGLCRIAYDQDGRLGVTQLPISAELQKTFDRVNWAVARTKATIERWNNFIYVALPLDEARVRTGQLVPDNLTYAAGAYTFPVVPGATYYFTPGANETSLTNGSETVEDASEFVAQGLTVTFNGTGAVTAQLQRQYNDVNTHVAVYDLLRGKWCGTDTGKALMVKAWQIHPFDGEDRLFFVSEDGFINLYEYTPYDEVATESLSNNLHATGVYDAFGYAFSTGLTPGRLYVYSSGAYETKIVNGDEVLAGGVSVGYFIARASTIYSYGATGNTIGFAYRRVDWTLDIEELDFAVDTRLYRWGSSEPKRVPWLELQLRTWRPEFTIKAVGEGYNEEWELRSAVTRSRETYARPHTRQPYDLSNYGDDHATRGREDYSVLLGDGTVASGEVEAELRYAVQAADVVSACSIEYNGVTYNNNDTFVGVAGESTFAVLSGSPLVYAPGSYVLPGENGIVFDAEQTLPLAIRLNRKLRGVQVRLSNAQGRCTLVSVRLEARAAEKHKGERQH